MGGFIIRQGILGSAFARVYREREKERDDVEKVERNFPYFWRGGGIRCFRRVFQFHYSDESSSMYVIKIIKSYSKHLRIDKLGHIRQFHQKGKKKKTEESGKKSLEMENYVTDKRARTGAPKGEKMIATIRERRKEG